MNDQLINWLLSIIGRKLVAVLALIYSYKGEKDFLNPQELDLQFISRGHGKLSCGGDGSSIKWQGKSINKSNLGDYGEQIIEDISDNSIWKKAINKTLNEAKLVESDVEKCAIGISFLFEGGICISILNLGDELYVYEEIPDEVIDDQEIIFSNVV